MPQLHPDDPEIWESHGHPHSQETNFFWRVLWYGIYRAQNNSAFKNLLPLGTPVLISSLVHGNLHHVVWRNEENQAVFALINIRPDETNPKTWTDSGFHINPRYVEKEYS